MMKNEFYEAYSQLFENSYNNLRRIIRIKLKAIRYCDRHTNCDGKHDHSQLGEGMRRASTIYRMSVVNEEVFEKIMAEKDIEFPSDFVFRPIEQYEVDEESSMFYSSQSGEDLDQS